jgi:membrane fusion protein, adhesin transport system
MAEEVSNGKRLAGKSSELALRNGSEFEDGGQSIAEQYAAALRGEAPRWSHGLLYATLAFFGCGLVWAHFAEIDVVNRGIGQIIPSSKIQVIQSLEGGIVSAMAVREGQQVKAGQELLRIDDTRFSSDLEESRARRAALLASVTRLEAEALGKGKLGFPKELNARPDLVRHERALFDSRLKLLRESIGSLQRNLDLARRERKLIQPMVDKRIIVERDQIKLDRQIVELEGRIAEARNEYRSQALTELAKDQGELTELEEKLRGARDRVERTSLRSPMDGIVKNISFNTVGGVIGPGDPIMEIVPLEDQLLVETKLIPKDIAFIHPGQRAVVRLTAYDFSVYGGLEGEVETVSADTLMDKENNPYYRIYVRTHENTVGNEDKPMPVIPGMTADVDIITGRKTVLDFLLKPIKQAQQTALRER